MIFKYELGFVAFTIQMAESLLTGLVYVLVGRNLCPVFEN